VTPEQLGDHRPLAPVLLKHAISQSSLTPHAMLSRAVAGIRKQTLIINLLAAQKLHSQTGEILPAYRTRFNSQKRPTSEKGHKI
jgi:molybdopterin biosynthesis enzyme MoaB